MDKIERARKVIDIERDALTDLSASIGENFEKAVELMLRISEKKGRIVVTGMGKSGLVGKKISSTFSSVGTRSLFIHPAEAIHGDVGMIAEGDLILAISNSGETEEILKLLPLIKRFSLKLVAVTGKIDSTLGRAADVALSAKVKLEACPWDMVPTASTTAVMALGDALALVMMEIKGFKQEDFATYHPSGSLGRGLLATVGDLMHTGGDIPSVKEDATMKETLKEMSAKKLGITLVCDASGRLTGIVTDGDLRRTFEKESNAMNKKAGEIMSGRPRTIDPKAMGGTAVKIMEENKITSIAIVSEGGKPTGVIHLHDLLRAGVV